MDAGILLGNIRIVPVVVIDDPEAAVSLAQTLCEASLPAVEITLRTPRALACIEHVARSVPGALVGAGSIRTAQQLQDARNAGARFGVSPGSSEQLLATATEFAMPFVPGAATASEMIGLMEQGYRLLKFFPAELSGGTAMLKALGAPLPELCFFPTGGISPERAPDYLSLPNVRCIGGSWIAPPSLLSAGDFRAIARIARDAASLAL